MIAYIETWAGWREQMTMPTKEGLEAATESAKAVQEVAKLGGKVTDIVAGGGRWIDNVAGGAIRDTLGLLWGDRVRAARIERAIADEERLVALAIRARERLRELGHDARREMTPKFGIALIEAATLEEEPALQALWANLLATAVDGDGDPVEKSYVSILADMSVADAAALESYYADWPLSSEEKAFHGDGIEYSPSLSGERFGLVVSRNLIRLGLMGPATNYFEKYVPVSHSYDYGESGGETEKVAIAGTIYGLVFTELGEAFCEAVGLNNRSAIQAKAEMSRGD
jgi:hypothetical protein